MTARKGRSERRARARKQHRAERKGGAPSRTRRRRSKLRIAIGVVVLAAAVAATVFVVRRPPRAVPAPPSPTARTEPDGSTVAVLDVDALREWCVEQELPEPPGLRQAEPEFATALLQALHAAATVRTAEAYGKVGMICESVESHGAARAYFELAQRANPVDHRWPYYLACIDQITGRTEDAAEKFRRVLSLEPDYAVTYARLGQIELDRGRMDAADSLFAAYTERASHDWLGLVGSGRVALRRGDAERALELLQEAERRGGEDFQVHRMLGRIHGALGNREEAERHFARSRKLPQGAWFRARDPLDEALHGSASAVAALEKEFERRSGTQDWAGLVSLGEEILRRRGGDVTMMGNLAGLYRKLGRLDDANAILDRAFLLGTDTLRLQLLRSEVALSANDFRRALAAADEALKLDPASARAHGLRARALLMSRRPVDAEAAMRRSLELQPDDAGNLLVLAEAVLAQGRLDAAEEIYRASLALAENDHARSRLAQIAENRVLEPDSGDSR